MSGQTSTAGDAPAVGCTKYASQVPSGVVMVTSDSVVAAAPPAGAPVGAAALPGAAGAGARPAARTERDERGPRRA